jgi:hypothetical protein
MSKLRAVFKFEHDLLIERTNASIVHSEAESKALSRLSALTRRDAGDAADALGDAGLRCARLESEASSSPPSGWTDVSRTGMIITEAEGQVPQSTICELFA